MQVSQEQPLLYTRVIVLDLETTGLPAMKGFNKFYSPVHVGCYDTARIVQIAWRIIDITSAGESVLISEHNHLIYPSGDFYMHPVAQSIHGITVEKLLESGETFQDVVQELEHDLIGVRVFVGHNVQFDFNVLASELIRAKKNAVLTVLYSLRRTCTMEGSTLYCQLYRPNGRCKWPKLIELSANLFPDDTVVGAHDASVDVEVTAKCYVELVRRGVMRC
jgi:DNA polymerase-3 subunit alpha